MSGKTEERKNTQNSKEEVFRIQEFIIRESQNI